MTPSNRRQFLRSLGIGGVALGGAWLLPRGLAHARPKRNAPILDERVNTMERVVAHAALAPSGHNTQPWRVSAKDDRHWSIGVDPARVLPAIDPTHRELMLSMGAFTETLLSCAGALGIFADMQIMSNERVTPELLALTFEEPRAPGSRKVLELVRRRRTVRRGHEDRPLRRADLQALFGAHGQGMAYFPRGSVEAKRLAEATVEAFRAQTMRDPAQTELANWMRFSRKELQEHCDGLTAESLELGTLSRFYTRNFLDRDEILSGRFRERSIDDTARLVQQGGGWLITQADSDDNAGLIEAGRRFVRATWRACEHVIAMHPMSQALEEEPFASAVARDLGLPKAPQLILRVGYVDRYPAPVSPRCNPMIASTSKDT